MDENIKTKIEKWIQEDGRRAERRVTESNSDSEGQSERVIELHLEDPRPLKLQQRIVEKIKPVIFERKIEIIDPSTGAVVERKTESIEQKVPMQVVDHIGSPVPMQKSGPMQFEEPIVPSVDNRPLNLSDKDLKTLVELLKNSQGNENSEFETKLKTLGTAAQVAKKSKDGFLDDKFLMLIILAQVAALGYVLFFM